MIPLVIGVLMIGTFLVVANGKGGTVGNTKLSAMDIATYAALAGFGGDDLITAVAVALAESSGDTRAYNGELQAGTSFGRGSFGLWQIYRQAHPEFDNIDLFDPQENANAAYQVYRAANSSFRPWSTYKNNSYVAHLDAAYGAINA